jgi:hypothetical protein
LKKYLVALCLFAASFAAQAQLTVIRVGFLFDQAGYDNVVAIHGTPQNYIAEQINYANTALNNSGLPGIQVVSAGYYGPGVCCSPYFDSMTQAVKFSTHLTWAARIALNADVMALATNYNRDIVGDPPEYESTFGVANGMCASNPLTATIAMNTTTQLPSTFVHELAHLLCAPHGQGYYGYAPGNAQTCENWRTIMSRSYVIGTYQRWFWRVANPGLSTPPGEGEFVGQAAGAMDANCPLANSNNGAQAVTYTCSTTGCVIDQSGNNAVCDHQRTDTITYLIGNPPAPPYIYTTQGLQAYGSRMSDWPPCPNHKIAPHFSNPQIQYKGLPTGVAGTNDNATIMMQRAGVVSGFHNLNLQWYKVWRSTISFINQQKW